MLQNQGRRVALVTDGRLSGASGKVPAAIHVTPEAARDGALAKLREGDMVRLDGEAGVLEALVDADEWASREVAPNRARSAHDVGRNLFALNRAMLPAADRGALSVSCGPPSPDRAARAYDAESALGGPPAASTPPPDHTDHTQTHSKRAP